LRATDTQLGGCQRPSRERQLVQVVFDIERPSASADDRELGRVHGYEPNGIPFPGQAGTSAGERRGASPRARSPILAPFPDRPRRPSLAQHGTLVSGEALVTICRCARGACTLASSRADAGLPPAPPGSGGCDVLGSAPAGHPRPADELVSGQRRDVLPGIECRGVGDQCLAQVCGKLVHHPAGHSLAAHRATVALQGPACLGPGPSSAGA
jgi:hypothetical protein